MTCPCPTIRLDTSSRRRDAAASSASRPSADDAGVGVRASREVSGQGAGGDNGEEKSSR